MVVPTRSHVDSVPHIRIRPPDCRVNTVDQPGGNRAANPYRHGSL